MWLIPFHGFTVSQNMPQITYFYFCLFGFGHMAWRTLVSPPGIEPTSPAVEAQSPNHWTTREVSTYIFTIDGCLDCFWFRVQWIMLLKKACLLVHKSMVSIELEPRCRIAML